MYILRANHKLIDGSLHHWGVPGRFLGFEAPFGSGIYKVLLASGQITQSQTVVFHDA
jgi:hypothetical protein